MLKFILFFSFISLIHPKLTCNNIYNMNNNIDWYFILSYPASNKNIYFTYIDSSNKIINNIKFTNEENFPPFEILSPFKKKYNQSEIDYFTFNSEINKGFFIFSLLKSEFILISHSLLKFPFIFDNNKFNVPNNFFNSINNFFCFSSENNEIINNLKSLDLSIIDSNFGLEEFHLNIFNDFNYVNFNVLTNFNLFLIHVFSKINSKILPFEFEIRNFFKCGFFIKNDYFNNEKFVLKSDCKNKFRLFNVNSVKLRDEIFYSKNNNENNENNENFNNEIKDNSKWAVAIEKNIVCFGDFDRNSNFANKKGNEYCFENKIVANFLRNIIVSYEDCDGNIKNIN